MEIREALEKAAAGETIEAPEPAPEPVESAPETGPANEAAQEPEKSPLERARDESGRFVSKPRDTEKAEAAPEGAKKADATKAAAPAPGKAAEVPPASVAAPVPEPVKGPQSWKPQAREAFAKAPPEVQQEVLRREAEITRALQESANERQLAKHVQAALSPYEGIARANGMDALGLAGSALQTVAVLQMGSPTQKAQAVAQVIRAYGVDVETLAAALDGQPAPQHAQQQPVNVQAEFERLWNARMQQAQAGEADRVVREFLDTKPEFIHTVANEMAAILNYAGQQNQNMTPEQAYEQACWMNPDVRAVLQQREAAKASGTAQATIQKAKAAAASPKSQPAAPPAGGQPKGVRGAMQAAAEKLGMQVE